jgi:hypothetical protein
LLDTPMLVLAFAWQVLLVVERVWGLTPLLETIGTAIWATFLVDLGLRFAMSPGKFAFLSGAGLRRSRSRCGRCASSASFVSCAYCVWRG